MTCSVRGVTPKIVPEVLEAAPRSSLSRRAIGSPGPLTANPIAHALTPAVTPTAAPLGDTPRRSTRAIARILFGGDAPRCSARDRGSNCKTFIAGPIPAVASDASSGENLRNRSRTEPRVTLQTTASPRFDGRIRRALHDRVPVRDGIDRNFVSFASGSQSTPPHRARARSHLRCRCCTESASISKRRLPGRRFRRWRSRLLMHRLISVVHAQARVTTGVRGLCPAAASAIARGVAPYVLLGVGLAVGVGGRVGVGVGSAVGL